MSVFTPLKLASCNRLHISAGLELSTSVELKDVIREALFAGLVVRV